MKVAVVLAFGVVLVACSQGTPLSTSSPELVTPTQTPFATPEATPASVASGPFDGIWASEALDEADFEAALERRGLHASGLPEWLRDWSKTSYRHVEVAVGNGRWVNSEYSDGVVTSGFESPLEVEGDSTIILTDGEANCGAVMEATRRGSEMTFEVTEDTCPNDWEAMTVLFESSPFHLVLDPAWSAPEATPVPSRDPSVAPPTRGPSTSRTRQTPHPIGTVDEAPLGYLEYLPPDYGTGRAPLLVALHGSGESGAGDEFALTNLVRGGIPSLIAASHWPDDRPFVVLSPQHEEDPPAFCFTAEEIDSFVRFALEQYDVDPSRVYLTGLSCGAIGLWNYLAEHGSDTIAAAIPIAGHGLVAAQLQGCDLGKTPIWAFHGERDDTVPVVGGVYPLTTLNSCTDPLPVDARLTIFPEAGHDVWTRVYGGTSGYDIYEWLLSHSR
jgi:predicted esterase